MALMVWSQEGETPALPDDAVPLFFTERDAARPEPVESPFPKFLTAQDMDRWRESDTLTSYREKAGDALFGIPLLVPRLVLEEFMPRGLALGPSTYLYRDSKDSKSLSLVVFDQALFHETEFLEQAQARGAFSEGDGTALTRSQRNVLQRSLMTGFRASYSLPSMSLNQIVKAVEDEGAWAYLLAPAAAGALLVLKGLDQKFSIDDVIKARVQVTNVRQWSRGLRSPDGLPAVSCEIRVANFPVAMIFSFEVSDHGMVSQFAGIGTSLSVVEDLLGREESRTLRPNQ
jgi:hypothetical protein